MSFMKSSPWLVCMLALSAAGFGPLLNQAHATTRYFDVNGTANGSGVTAAGSYSWEGNFWNNNDSVGTTTTTAWTEGDFPKFAAGTDAGVLNYTVTAGAAHTING